MHFFRKPAGEPVETIEQKQKKLEKLENQEAELLKKIKPFDDKIAACQVSIERSQGYLNDHQDRYIRYQAKSQEEKGLIATQHLLGGVHNPFFSHVQNISNNQQEIQEIQEKRAPLNVKLQEIQTQMTALREAIQRVNPSRGDGAPGPSSRPNRN